MLISPITFDSYSLEPPEVISRLNCSSAITRAHSLVPGNMSGCIFWSGVPGAIMECGMQVEVHGMLRSNAIHPKTNMYNRFVLVQLAADRYRAARGPCPHYRRLSVFHCRFNRRGGVDGRPVGGQQWPGFRHFRHSWHQISANLTNAPCRSPRRYLETSWIRSFYSPPGKRQHKPQFNRRCRFNLTRR